MSFIGPFATFRCCRLSVSFDDDQQTISVLPQSAAQWTSLRSREVLIAPATLDKLMQSEPIVLTQEGSRQSMTITSIRQRFR